MCFFTQCFTEFYLQASHISREDVSVVITGRVTVYPITKIYIFLSPRKSLSEILYQRLDCAKVNDI